MPTLLAIDVSPRHEFSTSRKLTALFIDQWKAARPGASVVVRDLTKAPPPFVDLAWIGIKDVEIILAGRARAGATGETAVEQFGAAVRSAAAVTSAVAA